MILNDIKISLEMRRPKDVGREYSNVHLWGRIRFLCSKKRAGMLDIVCCFALCIPIRFGQIEIIMLPRGKNSLVHFLCVYITQLRTKS
jgi:hypothetical protein